MAYIIVFFGAGFGGALRQGVNSLALRLGFNSFPASTLAINILGSLTMGLFAGYFIRRSGIAPDVKLFLTTGVLGGFTTFSTFSLDAVSLSERGEWIMAILYVLISVGTSLFAVALGIALVKWAISPGAV